MSKYYKFFFIVLILLSLNFSSNAYAGMWGKGELKLSKSTMQHLMRYLYGAGHDKYGFGKSKNSPTIFVVSADGNWSYYQYCPYTQCIEANQPRAIKRCEKDSRGSPCYVMALKRRIVWKNGNKKLKIKKSLLKDPSKVAKAINVINGNDTNNVLIGGSGNDTLSTGSGDDQLFGGLGDDILIINGTGDSVLDGGEGVDTFKVDMSHYVPPQDDQNFTYLANLSTGFAGSLNNPQHVNNDELKNIENIEYTGSISAHLYGDEGDNLIIDGSGADRLYGGDGNDILKPLGGDDSVYGEAGDDLLILKGSGDQSFNGGVGKDTLEIDSLGLLDPAGLSLTTQLTALYL